MFHQFKQTAAISIAIVCLIACQSIGKKSQVTIQSKALESQNMSQNDKFGDKKTDVLKRNTPLSKTDHFPKFYTFAFKHMVLPLYVRSSDKVVSVVDRADTLSFEGVKYPDENIILQEINRRFSVFQGYTLGLNKRSHDLKDAYMSSKKIYEEEQVYLKQAFKKFKTGRDFRKALLRETRYSYICNLIGPYSKSGTNVDSISQEYIGQVNSLKKELNNIIKTRKGTDRNVQETVYDYNRFLSRKAMKTDTAFEYQWSMAEQNFKGETQEFLKFRLLKEYYGAITNYNFFLEKFKKTCKDKDFVAYLDDWAIKNVHQFNKLELVSTLSDTAGQSLTWADILAKNKGKKIYLVSSEFPVFQLLGQPLTNKIADFEKNNTQIIFLSIDKNKEKWLKDLKMGEKKNSIMLDSSLLKVFNKVEDRKKETLKANPFQYYHSESGAMDILSFMNKSEGSKLYSTILIDENGKVVLSPAANLDKLDLLMRQLRIASKVILP